MGKGSTHNVELLVMVRKTEMSKRIQFGFFGVGAVLVALSVAGVIDGALAAVGVDADNVQMADAIVGLVGLLPLILLWVNDQRRESVAGQHVTIVLVSEDGKRLPLPYQPPRREVTTRAGLFGVLGGVAGARRFDVGHALLNVVSSGEYEDLVAGRKNSIEIPVPSREFEEFSLDAQAFEAGELRKPPAPKPALPPKPAPELIEVREQLARIAAALKIDQSTGGDTAPPSVEA